MNDSDLIVECKDGCTTIIRRGGYETHNLADAKEVGDAAGELCRRQHRRRVKIRLLAVSLLILIATGGVWGVMEHGRQRMAIATKLVSDGQALVHEGKDAEAVEVLTKALTIRPDQRTFRYRSFAYWRLCDFERCAQDLESAGDLKDAEGIRAYASTSRSRD